MANDVVLVPTYWRPEYLRETLESLFVCTGIENKDVWVFQDRRPTDIGSFSRQMQETFALVNEYAGRITYFDREPHRVLGSSKNIVEAYQKAFDTDYRYVYMVYEDVAVYKDFFKWHEHVQEATDCFCSISCSPDKYSQIRSSDDDGHFLSKNVFCDYGLCWKRENLQDVCKVGYDNIRIFGEQDCRIKELIVRNGAVIAGAYRPRSFHIGAVGTIRMRNEV